MKYELNYSITVGTMKEDAKTMDVYRRYCCSVVRSKSVRSEQLSVGLNTTDGRWWSRHRTVRPRRTLIPWLMMTKLKSTVTTNIRPVVVVLALAGQINSATTLDLFLPTSGDRQADWPFYGAMVERHDGPSWLRDDNDDYEYAIRRPWWLIVN